MSKSSTVVVVRRGWATKELVASKMVVQYSHLAHFPMFLATQLDYLWDSKGSTIQ